MAQIIAGLDMGSYSVRVARLKLGFRRVELDKLITVPREGDPWPAVLEATKGADKLITTLPGDQLSIRQLELPKAAAKRMDQVLRFELDGEVPFNINEMIIGHRVTKQVGEKVEVLAAIVDQQRLEEHLTELNEIGLNPRQVAATPIFLSELGKRAAPDETVVVVDIGYKRTDIVIVERGEFRRARTSSFGGAEVTRRLAKAFGVPTETAEEWKRGAQYLIVGEVEELTPEQRSAADAVAMAADVLVREIKQTLAAHVMGGGEQVTKVVLCGGGSRLRGLRAYLEGKLGVEVQRFTAPESIGNTESEDVIGGAKAIALALGATSHRVERINLRQGKLAFEGEVAVGRGVFLYALVAVFFIMLAWGFSAFAQKKALERQRDVQFLELGASSQRLLGKKIDSFEQLKSIMSKATTKSASGTVVPENDAFDVVEQISKRIPEKINHEIDSLDIRSGRVSLKGRVDKRNEADEIQKALSGWEDCFVKVPVPQTTPAVRDNRLQYTMDIETRCP